LISYTIGSYGSFIGVLLWKWLTNSDIPLTVSQHGDVKLYTDDTPRTNWKSILPITYDPIYTQIEPLESDKPFILFDHIPTSFDLLSSYYPNFQNIIITYTANDITSIAENWFYKIVVPEYSKEKWNRIAKAIFDDTALTPSNLSKEQVAQSIEFIVKYDMGYPSKFYMSPKIPEKYADRVTLIKFEDIVKNPDKILEILSNSLNLPITDTVIQNYNNYTRAQAVFREINIS
jgi:hypothetical protein